MVFDYLIVVKCKTKDDFLAGKSLERCGECSKIENPDSILMRRCHPKGGIGCVKWQKNEDSVNPANLLNSGK